MSYIPQISHVPNAQRVEWAIQHGLLPFPQSHLDTLSAEAAWSPHSWIHSISVVPLAKFLSINSIELIAHGDLIQKKERKKGSDKKKIKEKEKPKTKKEKK